MSLPNTEAPRPAFVLLARAITSSSSDQGCVGTIGPKGSSWIMRESLGGLSMIVGSVAVRALVGGPTETCALQRGKLTNEEAFACSDSVGTMSKFVPLLL